MLARDFVGALQVAEEVKLQNRFGAHESVIVEGRGSDCRRMFTCFLKKKAKNTFYDLFRF